MCEWETLHHTSKCIIVKHFEPSTSNTYIQYLFDYSFRNCIVETKGGKKIIGPIHWCTNTSKWNGREGETEEKHRKIQMRGFHTQMYVHNEETSSDNCGIKFGKEIWTKTKLKLDRWQERTGGKISCRHTYAECFFGEIGEFLKNFGNNKTYIYAFGWYTYVGNEHLKRCSTHIKSTN